MVARNVVVSQRRSDPGSIPGGATQGDIYLFLIFFFFFVDYLTSITLVSIRLILSRYFYATPQEMSTELVHLEDKKPFLGKIKDNEPFITATKYRLLPTADRESCKGLEQPRKAVKSFCLPNNCDAYR